MSPVQQAGLLGKWQLWGAWETHPLGLLVYLCFKLLFQAAALQETQTW